MFRYDFINVKNTYAGQILLLPIGALKTETAGRMYILQLKIFRNLITSQFSLLFKASCSSNKKKYEKY